MIFEAQNENARLTDDQVRTVLDQFLTTRDLTGKRVLMIVPDHTRSGPIAELFQMVWQRIGTEVSALNVLVALGTHPPMTAQAICSRLGITARERAGQFRNVGLYNHEWSKPETFKSIGTISADEIEQLSGGLFREEVNVAINRMVFDHDEVLILGPVFPHEVVGFSGGHKYIFPGIAGADIINFFHWLGAVITNPWINGNKWTATRQVVERAAGFIDIPRSLIALVARQGDLKGIFCGDVVPAWEKAADLSARVHIVYTDRAYKTVLGIAPRMYDDIWTAGKVMYKLEPVVADGGTLIIYAPHIDEISYTHGKILDEIGYHTRDYFLKKWDRFKHYPRGVTAHSTHVKGIGTFIDGQEKPRVNVILATGISENRCKKVNLGYMDPAKIDIEKYRRSADDSVLVVDHAGELLHRLKNGYIPKI